MKLVKFEDGKYGIRRRRWLFGQEFKVISKTSPYWRTMDDHGFWECRAGKQDAEEMFIILSDKGTEVKS